ncbi:MAG: tryptophan synthase subunit alpha [Phycisphaerales bacterium]|nr:tryptophan synthase subunit alpha [Phycisphaerales bacterium]
MNRIEQIFADLRREGGTALMPFIVGGAPSLDVTREVLPALEEAGASIVEIGVPFSDPIADGPVIASAMHEALLAGVTPRRVFDTVAEARPGTALGLVAMVSQSIVQRMGAESFMTDAAAAGFDGLIVPDVDVDTADDLARSAAEHGLTFSLLLAPGTNERRIARLVSLSTGFIYMLARTGVTGERSDLPDLGGRIELVRQHTDLPLCVGFGLSTPEQVAHVTQYADAAIVGSALVRRMSESADPVRDAKAFVRDLSGGLTAASGR